MIKSIYEKESGIEIDLTGPQGNAFFLLGTAKSLGEQMGLHKEEISMIIDDMQSSDYDHLVEVFDQHFGNFVTLYR